MTRPTVLITGATGFIGYRTLVILLRSDYCVRIAIRRPDQEFKIRNAPSIQPFLEHVTFIAVPDNTIRGAYETAVTGVHFVVHVASPVPPKLDIQDNTAQGKSWNEIFYDPAVKGTIELLDAVAKAPSVQRVAITSSGNVLASVVGEPATSPSATRRCPSEEEVGAIQNAGQAYKTSKILAITATRKAVAKHRANGVHHFGVFYVCPGYVQGAHELCDNVEDYFLTTSGGTLNLAMGKSLPIPVMSQIWVEDVAKAHVVGLTSPEVRDDDVLVLVGNEGKGWEWKDVGETLINRFPTEVDTDVLKPSRTQQSMPLNFDSRETQTKLGWSFAGPDVWATETVKRYLKLTGHS